MIELIESFILLLVIMDPVLSMGALVSLTQGGKESERRAIAVKAVLVAAAVFFFFAFGGNLILQVLGVTLDSFRAAGGIILVILGIQLAMGISFPKKEDLSELAVVIGTPLISGPAAITTTIILVNDLGLAGTLIAGGAALAAILLCLLLATRIDALLGRGGARVLSTMMGIVTIAWGMQFLQLGILGFLAGAGVI